MHTSPIFYRAEKSFFGPYHPPGIKTALGLLDALAHAVGVTIAVAHELVEPFEPEANPHWRTDSSPGIYSLLPPVYHLGICVFKLLDLHSIRL